MVFLLIAGGWPAWQWVETPVPPWSVPSPGVDGVSFMAMHFAKGMETVGACLMLLAGEVELSKASNFVLAAGVFSMALGLARRATAEVRSPRTPRRRISASVAARMRSRRPSGSCFQRRRGAGAAMAGIYREGLRAATFE